MSDALTLTKAQEAALRWLTRNGGTGPWTGGTLVGLYQERDAARQLEDFGTTYRPTTDRRHGWRRTGGKLLAALERAGAVRHSGGRYSPEYVLTGAGRRHLQATKGEVA